MFRQEIQKKEYYVKRIVETKLPKVTLPREKVDILVTKWDVVRQKVTVLEERLYEVGRASGPGDGLRNLLLFLHEAECLLACDSNNNISSPPAHFLLKQHEASGRFCVEKSCTVSRMPLPIIDEEEKGIIMQLP